MNRKNKIRLTESDLHRIVKMSVNKVIRESSRRTASKRFLRESDFYWDDEEEQDEYTNYPETFDEIYNDGQWQVILGGDGGRNMDRCYYVNSPAKNFRDINNAWQYWDYLITFDGGVRVLEYSTNRPVNPSVLSMKMVKELAEDYDDFEQVFAAMTGR